MRAAAPEPAGGEEGPLFLRDRLALERTVLANERTFLAYIRTGLTFLVAGLGLVHLFEPGWIRLLGWLLLPLGAPALVVGLVRFLALRRRLARTLAGAGLPPPPSGTAAPGP